MHRVDSIRKFKCESTRDQQAIRWSRGSLCGPLDTWLSLCHPSLTHAHALVCACRSMSFGHWRTLLDVLIKPCPSCKHCTRTLPSRFICLAQNVWHFWSSRQDSQTHMEKSVHACVYSRIDPHSRKACCVCLGKKSTAFPSEQDREIHWTFANWPCCQSDNDRSLLGFKGPGARIWRAGQHVEHFSKWRCRCHSGCREWAFHFHCQCRVRA